MVTFKRLVVSALVLYVAWYLLPQIEWQWMSEDALVIISYSGFESSLNLSNWMHWAFFAAMIVITGGLLFFGSRWRVLFVLYVVATTVVIVPLAGINVETGLSTALRDIGNLLFGALIALILVGTSADVERTFPPNKPSPD